MKPKHTNEPQPIRIEYGPGELTGDDLLQLRTAAAVARDEAIDLIDALPDKAASLSKLSRWARDFCARAEQSLAHPMPIAKPKRTPGPGFKIKHQYGPNGICNVDHDGTGPCGKVRERKPRAGSSAERAARGLEGQTDIIGRLSPAAALGGES